MQRNYTESTTTSNAYTVHYENGQTTEHESVADARRSAMNPPDGYGSPVFVECRRTTTKEETFVCAEY